tara:strand:- start:1066 stop:1821 length:756 start_codon:yes stop_codon:yes gene_type:complete
MSLKKISIITVVKNGMPFLEDSIRSFDNQDYKNKEHIIVYSDSKDETENFLNKFKKSKIIVQDYKSKTKFGSLNIGIKLCSGDIIGILHADDMYPNNTILSEVCNFFEKTNADITYGDVKFCDKYNKSKIVRNWKSNQYSKNQLKFGWMPPHTSIYAKKNILENNLYSENYPISGDYKFILDLFLNQNYKINYINKNLCLMRTGGDSTHIKGFIKKLREDLLITKSYFKNNYLCVFFKIIRKVNQLKLFGF